ncbi:uncharacterized protein JCM6883_005725 [Sporobolomyces salmoneus]|uniref:uncharacterized protein n=1 Tax=Sporobolomyces salmoneus TaxID=183962 RepID=UPI003173C75F
MAAKNSYSVQSLLTKLKNPDADLRFMALQDLINEATQPTFSIDETTEHQLVDAVLGLLNDPNGEVKSVAVKTLATLTPSVNSTRIRTIIDRLVSLTASNDEGVRDIASLGLKMVVAEVQPGSTLATTCCKDLAPEVLKQVTNSSSSAELLIDSLDLLSDIVTRFESTVRGLPHLQTKILQASVPLLGHSRAAVRKRSVGTIATLIPTTSSSSSLFPTLLSDTLLPSLESSNSSPDQLLTSISLISSVARTSPSQLGPHISTLIPLILSAISSSRFEGEETEIEIKEGGLICLESLVLKCKDELKANQGLIGDIVEKAKEMLKFDPNYAGGDDDGDEAMDVEGEEEDELDEDDFEDEYDDEDDTSWRVRRSSAKLLASLISTRPDLLPMFYKSVSPALIARFGDREETVKVEIWGTETTLLRVTREEVLGQKRMINTAGIVEAHGLGSASPRSGLKRKRSADQMSDDDGPIAQLNVQTPSIVKSIVGQLTAKSLSTRQAGFALLHELVAVLSGGLESQIPLLVTRVEASLKTTDSGLSGAATQLKIEVLSLLALFFKTHHPKTYSDELPRLVPLIVAGISDRFNKIAAEAFVTASSLIRALRPVSPNASTLPPAIVAYLTSIYQATMDRLQGPDADEEVKGKGIQTLGTLLFHAGDYAAGDLSTALSFLRDRLKIEVQRIVTVQTVGFVASSPVLKGSEFDQFVLESLSEVSSLLRKVHRPLKIAAFDSIDALLARAATSGVPEETSAALLQDLEPLLTDSDVNLLPHALNTAAGLLTADPSAASSQIEETLLPRIYQLVQSPLVQGPSLEGLLRFFQAYLKAGAEPGPLIKQLGSSAAESNKGKTGEAAGIQNLVTASKCIGMIVKESPSVGDSVAKDNEKILKSSKSTPASLVLALLTLGEVGRVTDFTSHASTFKKIVEQLGAGAEDVRRSAAFAAGNVAVGNTEQFLPTILDIIEKDDKKRYLALQALKEVIIHSSPEALASISDTLWTPLFENYDHEEESTRNVAADCIGHLTTSNPSKYLPQLQSRLGSSSAHDRATVIAALRFTFTNDSTSYDELLAPLIVEFFKLMKDSDLGVRRLALSSLNSAAHNKPHLVRDHLSTLLPELYEQSVIDKSLIRIVEMGPFKHKVDDGLDIRKAAYECMHSIFENCLKEITIEPFLVRVIAGLSDEEEIKKICYILIVKLAQVAPSEVTQHLDETVEPFTGPFNFVMKENSTKQDAERSIEQQKSITRCVAVLGRLANKDVAPKFCEFVTSTIEKGPMSSEYKEALRASQSVAMDLD